MLASFVLLCCGVSLAGFGLLNRIAYALYRPLNKKLNDHLVTVSVHRIFAILRTYINFRVKKDYTNAVQLPEQYLLISNHQSLMDILILMDYLEGDRLRFVAKKELGTVVPFVSLVLRSGRHCLIRRKGGLSGTMRTMDRFAERVKKNNWIPVLFPEGTRSRDGTVGTFYSAGFRRVLAGAPMPVVVAALDGGWNIASLSKMMAHTKNGLYHVKVLKVFPAPANKEEQLAVLAESKQLIEEQIETWRSDTKQA